MLVAGSSSRVIWQRPAVVHADIEVGSLVERSVRPGLHVVAKLRVGNGHSRVLNSRGRQRGGALATGGTRGVATVRCAAGGVPVGDLAMEFVARDAGTELERVGECPLAAHARALLPQLTLDRLDSQRVPVPEVAIVQIAARRHLDHAIAVGVEIDGDTRC